MATQNQHSLFTIGYEQTPPKAVLDELRKRRRKTAGGRARGGLLAPSGFFQEPARRSSRRARHFLSSIMKGLGTPKEGRLAARSGDMKTLRAHLRKAPEDAAGQGRTRRIVVAGDEGGPGLPALLRARPCALPSQMGRRDHRRPRRREGRKSAAAATLSICRCTRRSLDARGLLRPLTAFLVALWRWGGLPCVE